jgi:Tfp pilus assembly protein PilX
VIMHKPIRYAHRRAAVLIFAMLVLLVLTLLGGELVRTMVMTSRRTQQDRHHLQAAWLAESGVERALAQLESDKGYGGEVWQPTVDDAAAENANAGKAKVTIIVEQVAGTRQVRVEALYPDQPVGRVAVERVYILPSAQQESSP